LIEVSWYAALQALAVPAKVVRRDSALVTRAIENSAMTSFISGAQEGGKRGRSQLERERWYY
jgi:hypothetical protein